MTRIFASITALAFAAGFAGSASATMSDITTTEPADASAFANNDPDDAVLTFLAQFSDSNSGENTLPPDVVSYLAGLGHGGEVYLGRSDGTGGTGTSVNVTGGGTSSGHWTLNPGSTGDVAGFLVMHAGEGRTYDLYQIDTPGTTGIWDTSDLGGHGLSFIDLFGGAAPRVITHEGDAPVPEPASLSLLGAALAGLATAKRRKVR